MKSFHNFAFRIENGWATNPANICWSSRHVLKTSSTRLQRNNFWSCKDVLKMSWKTENCYAEDVFKTSWKHVLKTSWRHFLKTSWRHFLKTSWRHVLKVPWRHFLETCSRGLGDKQNVYRGYLYLPNLNVYLINLYFTNLYLTNLRSNQNALIRPQ